MSCLSLTLLLFNCSMLLAVAEQSHYWFPRVRIVFAVVYIQEATHCSRNLIRINRFRVGPFSALSGVRTQDGKPCILCSFDLFSMIFPLARDASATVVYSNYDSRFAFVLIAAFKRLPQLP